MNTSRSFTSILATVALCAAPVLVLTGCNDEAAPATRLTGASVVPLSNPTQQQAPAETPVAPPAESTLVSGEIVSTSSDSIVIESSQSGSSTTVSLTDDTIIMVDGKSAESDELKAGQVAIASTERQGDKVVAVSVSARSTSESSAGD